MTGWISAQDIRFPVNIQLYRIIIHKNNFCETQFFSPLCKAFCQKHGPDSAAADNRDFHKRSLCDVFPLYIRFIHAENSVDQKYTNYSKKNKNDTHHARIAVIVVDHGCFIKIKR